MAESQMALAREQLASGLPADRSRVVRMAGRSIHPDGVDLVMEGLADRDQDVVLGALRALRGRGGKPALRQLQLLLADQVEAIRLATVNALVEFGQDGRTLLEAALRDPEAKVRLVVLRAFQTAKARPDGALLCKVLGDSDPAVALAAAGLHGGSSGGDACDLGTITSALKAEQPADRRKAMAVLSAMGGEKAVEALELALKDVAEQDRLSLSAALARAGSKRPDVIRLLQSAFDGALTEIDLLAESWVSGKLPARGAESTEPSMFDGNAERIRLSEEEISKLYKKHGLGPSNPNSPRGINDILAGFEEPDPQKVDPRLFGPVSTNMVDRISMALDGLLFADPQRAGAAVGRALALKSPAAQARVAQVLLTHGVTVELNEQMLANLASSIAVANVVQTRALADWVSRSKDPRLVTLLAVASEKSEWEKRIPLIDALGRFGGPESIKALTSMLRGYSAISVARALAKIGDKQAIEPLRLALKQAGPAEEMEILLALAKLGSKAEVPRLVAILDSSNPDLRLFAVQVLGKTGPGQGLDALEGLRYDLDRLVRAEVKRVLEKGSPREEEPTTP
jgi:HEAT repeat protein